LGKLSDDKKEALEMTAHKIGRILNGDAEYKDSWLNIIGYIRLVEVTLVLKMFRATLMLLVSLWILTGHLEALHLSHLPCLSKCLRLVEVP